MRFIELASYASAARGYGEDNADEYDEDVEYDEDEEY